MIDLTKQVNYKAFKQQDFSIPHLSKDYIKEGNQKSFFSQMMDCYGEMNYTLKVFRNKEKEKIKKHLLNFHEVCCLIYNNPNVTIEEKDTLKFAEGEFINYILGNSDDKSCIKWFEQGNNEINYEML